ncbi:MAG TPA: hypothetical protein VIV11_05030 [Kofleriaceae bacterium]
MRRLAGLVILAAAGGALATPTPPPPLTWADWIGDWDGKLKWTSCTAEGEPRASLAVDARDGSVSIDLTPAGSALTQLSLVEDGAGWMGQQGDVTVRVKLPKSDKLEVAVDLDSGCQVRGTLTRASVGIPACDRLAAWARIESHCTKLSRPPLENAARLARQRASWRKAQGDDKTKLAQQCTARSAKVEQELVEIGCAPHPDPAIGNRGAECQALRGIAGRIARCSNLPSDQRDAYAREVLVLIAAVQGADKATLPVVDAECKRERDKLFAIAQQVGCPP